MEICVRHADHMRAGHHFYAIGTISFTFRCKFTVDANLRTGDGQLGLAIKNKTCQQAIGIGFNKFIGEYGL